VTGPQDPTEAQAQVQKMEADLSPSQMQQLQQIQQQQQNGRKLAQVTNSDLAMATDASGTMSASPTQLAQIHATNQNYQAQKQAVMNACAAKTQADQQAMAAATSSDATNQAKAQLEADQQACNQQLVQLRAQVQAQNMNAAAWVSNVDWAAIPWPSTQPPSASA